MFGTLLAVNFAPLLLLVIGVFPIVILIAVLKKFRKL
jgi:high-affinity nickel permease